MCSEFGEFGDFVIKKWFNDNEIVETETLDKNISYLTKSVTEHVSYQKKLAKEKKDQKKDLPKNKKTKKQCNPKVKCLKQAKVYIKDKKGPVWKFLNYILRKKFYNYVFVCDTDTELKAILSELKSGNIPCVAIGEEKLIQIHIEGYNIRITSRERFIAGKWMLIAPKYGVNLENLWILPST